MKKFLVWSTIVLLTTLLLFGIYAPASYLMLFAATTEDYTVIRAGLILVLFSLLIYEPPREATFRVALAVVASLLLFSASSILINYELKLFDALLLFETAVLLYIEAAELGVGVAPERRKKIPVRVSRSVKVQAT